MNAFGTLLASTSTSAIPDTGASTVVTTIKDTATDLWPVLAISVGIGVMVKLVKRFA